MELSLSLGFARREKKVDEEEEERSIRLSLDLPSSRSGSIFEASIKETDVINRTANVEDQAVTRSGNSEEEENGILRKKLRLSKEQSAFLEESFKEHNTLDPKQKVELAKQLNLRPRQVEVWFQNRRARTKLKQTEVDCEYLKRCCETLTEENRRLHKELAELRALRSAPSGPCSSRSSAATLSMCPSCERTTTNTAAAARRSSNSTAPFTALVAKPTCFAAPFAAS